MSLSDCPKWTEPDRDNPAFVEVVKQAGEQASARARREIPDSEAVKAIHTALFRAFCDPRYVGEFRRRGPDFCLHVDVGVPDSQRNLVPGAAFDDVPIEMVRWEQTVRRRPSVLELKWDHLTDEQRVRLLAAAVGAAVGEFVKIHPFINGNGRTSRVCWRALLARFGVGAWFSQLRRPPQPYGALMEASMKGDHGPFIAHVLFGLAQSQAAPHPAE